MALKEKKAYLSAILDLKGRDMVSFAVGGHNNNQLVFGTFDFAIQKYLDARPLLHSDRGFQYSSKQFKAKLDKQGMKQSMSRVGRCIDNGPMEGFCGILKCEMYYIQPLSYLRGACESRRKVYPLLQPPAASAQD